MKKVSLGVVFGALLFTSCASRVQLASSDNMTKITKIERIVDTVELIRSDTATITALLECDSIGRVRVAKIKELGGELSNLKSTFDDNMLRVDVVSRDVERVREVVRVDTLYRTARVREVVEVEKKIPRFKQLLMWIGVAALLFVGFKLYRIVSVW